MNKTKIEDPETFQFASVVIKDSKTGITSNRRLLVVRGGHMYYYSNVPKFFNGNPKSLQYIHQLPKSSIDLINIKRLKSFEPSSSQFEIAFDEMFMMQRQDIRKTLIQNLSFTPKSKKQQVVWRFTCENYVVKQKWIQYLSELREYFLREKDEIQKYFWNINEKDQMTSQVAPSKGAKTPWRESTLQRKQYSGFEAKSFGDVIPDLQFLQNGDKSGKVERISSSRTFQTNLQTYGAQCQSSHKADGLKHLNMKKVKTMQLHSTKNM